MRQFLALFILIIASLAITSSIMAETTEPLTYGDVVTNTLSNDGYEQVYTFEGQAGDTILIQMTSEITDMRLDSFLLLADAQGNDLLSDDDSGGNLNALIGPYTLQTDGEFTIIATRYQRANGGSLGEYTLTLDIVEPVRIELDTPFNVNLEAGALVDFFTFTAPEEALYRFDLRSISGDAPGDVTIRDENGFHINGLSIDPMIGEAFSTMRLADNQTVTLIIRNYGIYQEDGNQEYTPLNVQLTISNPQAIELDINLENAATISGTLQATNQPIFYSFYADAGQIIQIEEAGSQGDFELYLIMPSGMTNYYGSTYYIQDNFVMAPQILTQTGDYGLVIYRTNNHPDADPQQIVEFTVTVALDSSATLIAGVPIEGTVSPEQTNYIDNAYVYYGRTDETITVTVESLTESHAPSFSIEHATMQQQNPHQAGFFVNFNSSAPGTVTFEVTLPEEGAYIFRMYDGIYEPSNAQAEYRITVTSQ